MLIPITALFAGLALAKPLGRTSFVDAAQAQPFERTVSPQKVVSDISVDFSYECMPMENGPWQDCRGLDFQLSDMKTQYGTFLITLFKDRCWTLQSGVCRLYVCLNANASFGPDDDVTIDAESVRHVVADNFQTDCNAGNENLAGHAWNADRSIEIFSGVA